MSLESLGVTRLVVPEFGYHAESIINSSLATMTTILAII